MISLAKKERVTADEPQESARLVEVRGKAAANMAPEHAG